MLRLTIEWAPPGASPTRGELFKHFIEAIRTLGWTAVWVERIYDGKPSVYRPELANDYVAGDQPPPSPNSKELLYIFMTPDGARGGDVRILAPLPATRLGEAPGPPRLRVSAAIPACSRDDGVKVLRRLVHLSTPRFAAIGQNRTVIVAPTLLYVHALGRPWFDAHAPHVKLSAEATGGAWILAHGEDLASKSEHAQDANTMFEKLFFRWDRETSKPETTAHSDVPPKVPYPSADTGTLGPPPVPTKAWHVPVADPDMTLPPTQLMGPALPFIAHPSSVKPEWPADAAGPEQQSGETVALGELPLLVRGFSLPRYARLRAELTRHGEDHGPTLAAFGLDPAGKQALQDAFLHVFQSRPDVLSAFSDLVALANLRRSYGKPG